MKAPVRIAAVFAVSALVSEGGHAQEGAGQSGPIKIGMSAALSRPAKSLGQNMKRGIVAHFDRINRDGGIGGRELQLIAADDGYVPEVAKAQMLHLIDIENVIALAGNVGTPTAKVTVPIANEKKTLLFGAFTGAGLLRKTPPDSHVINYRASYAEETAAMVSGLLESGIRPFEIAFFSQSDLYGDAGYHGALDALRKAGYSYGSQLVHGQYTRNRVDVEDAVLKILESRIPPRAIIMISAYRPCAKFVRMARPALPKTLFLNVSFVGSTALARDLGTDGEGVIVTQVVPHYDEAKLPLVAEYRQEMKQYFPDDPLGFVSLEGYVVAKILSEGLLAKPQQANREGIVDALESLGEIDIGIGAPIHLSETSHQGSHQVWPTQLRDGKFVPIEWSDLKSPPK